MGWAGLIVKKEADPPTIAPAIGAWIMSLAISFPLIKVEMMKEPRREAAMEMTMQKGPMKLLK